MVAHNRANGATGKISPYPSVVIVVKLKYSAALKSPSKFTENAPADKPSNNR